MKKILFLLLVTISSYGQTYQNPTFGTVTEKTNAEDNTATKIKVQDANGKSAWINKSVFPLDTDVIHTTGNLSETANGLKTFSDKLTFGETSGSPQDIWQMPANSLLKYNNLQTIQYGFNITTLGADSFFWLNDEGVARQCLLYADGDSTIDSDVFGISGSQDSGGSWTKNFSVTQGGNVYVRSLLTLNGETASTLASFDASKNVKSLPLATYPSLTEISYSKGVTSSLQTQLNGKQATLTNPITGTGVSGQISFWNGTSTHAGDNGLVWDNTNKRLGVGVASPMFRLDVRDTNGGTFFDGTNATYNRWKSFGTLSTIAKPLLISAQTSGTTPDIYIHTSGGVSMGNTTDPGASNLSVTGNITSTSYSGTATLTGNPTAPNQTLGDNDTSIANTAFVVANSRPYKLWVGKLTQSGTSAPTTASVQENTFGGTIVWSYSAAGTYIGTLASAFDTNKTYFFVTQNSSVSNAAFISLKYGSANTIELVTRDVTGAKADNLATIFLEIRTYP